MLKLERLKKLLQHNFVRKLHLGNLHNEQFVLYFIFATSACDSSYVVHWSGPTYIFQRSLVPSQFMFSIMKIKIIFKFLPETRTQSIV
jgi:thiaminase